MPETRDSLHQPNDGFALETDSFDMRGEDDAPDTRGSSALAVLTSWTATRHAAADDGGGASGLKTYGIAWLRQALIAFVIALVCNGLWGIPLYQVVDVNLALALSWTALYTAALAIIFGYEVFNGLFRGAAESLLYIAALVFLPFGAIAGYMIYSWLGGGEVTTASFVYKLFVGIFVKGYTYLSSIVGDIFGAIRIEQTDKGAISSIDSNVVLNWLLGISAAIGAADVLRRWAFGTR